MARKPSIILTTADKKSAAKDLRGELKDQKAKLKALQAEIKTLTKVETTQAKLVTGIEERLAAMDEGCRRPRTRKASGAEVHHGSNSGGQGVDALI